MVNIGCIENIDADALHVQKLIRINKKSGEKKLRND